MPGRDRARRCRLRLRCSFLAQRQRDVPAQPRPRGRAVEIIEAQPVALQRNARRQADVLRQRIGGFQIEQRRETGVANLQIEAGLRLRRQGFGGALRFGIETRPDILACSCNGARHAPVTDPSNCAAPSPTAITRSSPSSTSSARPCSEDTFVSTPMLLRRSVSRSMPRNAAGSGFAVMAYDALELRRFKIDNGARVGLIGVFGILVDVERQFQTSGSLALSPSNPAATPPPAPAARSWR